MMQAVWRLRVVHAVQYASGDCTQAQNTNNLALPGQKPRYKGQRGACLPAWGGRVEAGMSQPLPWATVCTTGIQKGKLPTQIISSLLPSKKYVCKCY
mmetsp:Transcript_2553/g.4573  ORF Transcript_2553/g.4573 Transcript_2553/m.4573 type:complete len:97 (+) Transcript_2553:207-497(+)